LRKPTPDEVRETGNANGLYVSKVGVVAERAGVLVGDFLLALNTDAVTTVEQAQALAEKAGKSVALLLLRDGARVYIPLRLD